MITFQIIEDPVEAKNMWELFSPHKRIDHEWEFRDAWTQDYDFPFHFIVGYDDDKPIGLLPLQLNTLKGLGPKLLNMQTPYLEFFAGIDTDENDVWILPEYKQYKNDFFRQVKKPAVLTSLTQAYEFDGQKAEYYLDRFELDLIKNPDINTYLQQAFDGKGRSRLKGRVKKMEKNYAVEIKQGEASDLELLFAFSTNRFGERSSFTMPDRQAIYKRLMDRCKIDLLVFELNGEKKAVSFGLIYKNIYTTVNLGYDTTIRDLLKVLVYWRIERAQEQGYEIFDVGQSDNGWKSHFHFTKIPQYKLTLNMPERS